MKHFTCPKCGKELWDESQREKLEVEGALIVCFYCHTPAAVEKGPGGYSLRRCTDAEVQKVAAVLLTHKGGMA